MIIFARAAFLYIYTSICWFSNFIIVHSRRLKSILTSDYKITKEKILVIPHGVPLQNTERIKEFDSIWLGKLKNKKIILNFGYVVRRKGLEYLIDAFGRVSERYPEYLLVIAGGTLKGQEDYIDNLKKMVIKNRLSEKIIFTSFINESELGMFFNTSEFVVLPSLYYISASGPLAQAISFHKPVIRTAIGVFQEEITDGMDGLLCIPKNVQSLEKAMLRLIEDSDLKKKISENLKKIAKERSWTNIATETYRAYANPI